MPDKRVVLLYAAAERRVCLPWMWEAHSYLVVCNDRLTDAEKRLKLARPSSPPPTRTLLRERFLMKKKIDHHSPPAVPAVPVDRMVRHTRGGPRAETVDERQLEIQEFESDPRD